MRTKFIPKKKGTSEKDFESKIHLRKNYEHSLPEFVGCGVVFNIYRNRE